MRFGLGGGGGGGGTRMERNGQVCVSGKKF